MSSNKFFRTPFATSGDKTPIPNDIQPGGEISYEQGWGPDYSIADTTNPNYLATIRQDINQLMFVSTGSIQQYQTTSVPEFITAADNGGVDFPYARYSRVKAADTLIYESLVDANTDTPPSSNWTQVSEISTFYNDISATPNVYTLVVDDGKQEPTAYFAGMRVGFAPHEENAGASTIQVGSLPAANVFQELGSPTNINGGAIKEGIYQEFIYRVDGVNGDGFILAYDQTPSLIQGWNVNTGMSTSNDKHIELASNRLVPQGEFADYSTLVFRNSGNNTGPTTMSIVGNPDMQNKALIYAGTTPPPLDANAIQTGYFFTIIWRSPLDSFVLQNARVTAPGGGTSVVGVSALHDTITSTSLSDAATANSVRLAALNNNFTFNIGSNGYYLDNDHGFLIQWGSTSVTFTAAIQNVILNFPLTFGAVWRVNSTSESGGAVAIGKDSITIITTTTVNILYERDTGANFNGRIGYIAIGRI